MFVSFWCCVDSPVLFNLIHVSGGGGWRQRVVWNSLLAPVGRDPCSFANLVENLGKEVRMHSRHLVRATLDFLGPLQGKVQLTLLPCILHLMFVFYVCDKCLLVDAMLLAFRR